MNRRDFVHGSLALGTLAGCASTPAMSPAAYAPVRTLMTARLNPNALPGAVWLIAKGDDVFVDKAGVTAIGGVQPMARNTIFRIASMTKAFTAACCMMLVEDGKLELDAPAERWLPELAHRRVLKDLHGPVNDTAPANRAINVRDILNFTFGFGILFDNPPIQQAIDALQLQNGQPTPMTPHAPDEWMRRFGTLPLMHQPGEAWMYNSGSLIQGVLIARASGQKFDDFMRARLIAPLGLRDTDFFVPAEKLGRFAGCGVFTNPQTHQQSRMDQDGAASAYAAAPIFPSGAAGLVSTVDDYLVFARLLMKGGLHNGQRLLSAESVRQMTSDQLTPAQKAHAVFFPGFFDTHGWGFGVGVSTAPDGTGASIGSYGWDGGFGTAWINDPAKDQIAIVMTQSSDVLFDGTLDRFWKAVNGVA